MTLIIIAFSSGGHDRYPLDGKVKMQWAWL